MSVYQKPVLLKLFFPILFFFVFVSSFALLLRQRLNSMNIDNALLLYGNLLLFLVTAVSFFLYRKALLSANTQLFLRNVYGGMMLKLFLCLIAAFIYISAVSPDVNRPGLILLMVLYLFYTSLEVIILLKISRQIKQQKDA